MRFDTYRYADLSTCHIKSTDSEALERRARAPLTEGPIVYQYEEGFFVWVPAGNPELLPGYLRVCEAAGLSKQFRRVIAEACKQECTFVRLDRDGAKVDGLPVYSW